GDAYTRLCLAWRGRENVEVRGGRAEYGTELICVGCPAENYRVTPKPSGSPPSGEDPQRDYPCELRAQQDHRETCEEPAGGYRVAKEVQGYEGYEDPDSHRAHRGQMRLGTCARPGGVIAAGESGESSEHPAADDCEEQGGQTAEGIDEKH